MPDGVDRALARDCLAEHPDRELEGGPVRIPIVDQNVHRVEHVTIEGRGHPHEPVREEPARPVDRTA